MSSRSSKTRAIELTPPGRAAVAVVLVAGPDAVPVVEDCLVLARGRRLSAAPLGRILVGRWGAAGEEVVVAPRSPDAVEIHCHGGVAAVRAIIEQLQARGCEPVAWRDWLRESNAEPIRAAAQIALADAPTARTAAILLDQLHGALEAAVRTVLAASTAGDWPTAIQAADAVLRHRNLGLHLTTPWRVVLAGRPNVGKSSLLNALAGYQRAIVCDEPGTTRDVVTVTTAIDGWPVELIDTAGLRDTADKLESAGVARAALALAEADLVVLVADVTERARAEGVSYAQLPPEKPVLHVVNKVDLWPRSSAPPAEALCTSARTGAGIGDLVSAIGQRLVPAAPPAGAAVPFTADQVSRLEAARRALRQRDATGVGDRLRPLLAP